MAEVAKALTPKQIARRESIIKAVRSLLSRHGYDGVSMREVATEAGVSPSTLYEIYESKDTLILESVRNFFEDMGFEEESVPAGIDRFVHRLKAIANFFETANKRAEGVSRLLFQDQNNEAATEVLLRNAVAARQRSIEEMIEAGQIENVDDIERMARMLVSITWGTALFYQRGEIDIGTLASELVQQSMTLLLPYAAAPRFARKMKSAAKFG